MQFNNNKAIYLQIADTICEQVIADYQANQKIASVRETAVTMQVNPNTVMRAYSHLESLGVIAMQRGVGYFLTEDAKEKVLQVKRQEFVEQVLPEVFHTMDLLGLSFEDLQQLHNTFSAKKS